MGDEAGVHREVYRWVDDARSVAVLVEEQSECPWRTCCKRVEGEMDEDDIPKKMVLILKHGGEKRRRALEPSGQESQIAVLINQKNNDARLIRIGVEVRLQPAQPYVLHHIGG